ncbi:MAG TPA: prepilin-type N-terminal cleavage/methylation domain-containing protein [Bdellovibrionota bacterium]|nr:prepilin-type N-terminal cleavage/methylation domain-containing protein [Bdellovibrionota bacterium]
MHNSISRPISRSQGFTLVEILVAMVVLAIGLLGMAAMTTLVIRGNQGASMLTSATNICQAKIESLKDVAWADLGNWDAVANVSQPLLQKQNGENEGRLVQEIELNSEGKTKEDVTSELSGAPSNLSGQALDDAVADRGPYKLTRTFVICKGEDYSNVTIRTATSSESTPSPGHCDVAPGASGDIKGIRSKWLVCEDEDITSTTSPEREKKLKVLCTWRARDGQCHNVHLDTTVVKLQ